MRPIYFVLKIILPYLYSIFFRRKETIDAPKKYRAKTIFVCNHPSAFLDPLLIASSHNPIVHFMTRSDVFKWWLKPITWACHMVPIYRAAQDGAGTYDKNQNVFRGIRKVLLNKKSLIVFGEGYTDDTFIRSLKPMKKGAARIGFGTMDATNWEENIVMQAVGANYTDPSKFGSEVIISYGKKINLKDYKSIHDENPNKAITQLTRKMGDELRSNITYIKDRKKADFLENLLKLSRKGMNHENHDSSIPLKDRFEYSRSLATRMNKEYIADYKEWSDLEKITTTYFNQLKNKKVKEKQVYTFVKNNHEKKTIFSWIYLALTLPIFLISLIHNLVPYIITKKVVEGLFKRKVFWSGVKVVLGGLIWLLINLPVFWLFPNYIYDSFWLTLVYFLTVPALTFIFFKHWIKKFKDTWAYTKVPKKLLEELSSERSIIKDKMKNMRI